jgi:hypothetical protein
MHQVSGRRVRVDQFCNLGNVIDRTGDPEPSALINLGGDDGPQRIRISDPEFDRLAGRVARG